MALQLTQCAAVRLERESAATVIRLVGRLSELRTRRDVTGYVVRVTGACIAVALAFDIVNQLVFFEGWAAAFRSWGITVAIVVVVAIPVARALGLANLALFEASRTDHLTGLLNRRALLETFDDGAAIVALIIVDVDRFKRVNDTHGHLVGDTVLRRVAGVLTSSLSHLGAIGRLGGEEFAVLAADGSDAAIAGALEQLRDRIAATPIIAGAAAVSVTVSAGYARRTGDQRFEDLYARADRALYLAKAAGRNRIVSADEIDGAPIARRQSGAGLAQGLRSAG